MYTKEKEGKILNIDNNEEEHIISELTEDLQDLENVLKTLTEFLPIPICYVNPLNNILDINRSFEEFSKFSSYEIIGEDINLLIKEKKNFSDFLKTLFKKGKLEEEFTFITKEKIEIPVKINASTRIDESGEVIGYFISFIDITKERKFKETIQKEVDRKTKELKNSQKALLNILEDVNETKSALETEKRKVEGIINNLVDGLILLNPNLTISLANPSIERLLEINISDLVNNKITDFKKQPDLKSFFKFVKRLLKKDKVIRKEYIFNEQRSIYYQVTFIPLYQKKIFLGYLITIHDISREKYIEKMKSEFISIAAHQLRTPLTIIKWSLKLLLNQEAGKLNKEQMDFILKSYRVNERMIRLVNELLNVSRIEEGRFLYKFKKTQIEDLIKTILKNFENTLKNKNLKLSVVFPKKKLPKVFIDEEKMTLVINNLIENAIHYTNKGGKIKISVTLRDNEILFKISDTGVGIPEDQQDRIFSKFFRARNAFKMHTEGSGLGLFIVKNIIEEHKGKIWFESKEKKGTTFYFTIPIKFKRKLVVK